MKHIFTLVGVSLLLLGVSAWAQLDSRAERAVHIVQGPSISNVTRHSAVISWTTNAPGANHVRYRAEGSRRDWQSAYHQGGGTNHSLELTGLEPGRVYEWQILTRDGDVRREGKFRTR
ncbi:MAG TPA: fibronectin type III domain-containing protein [Candidatus Angelobacter sp.]|nr:fibronectin type III domain-containing protein [Candidatus Angelobacter sp.]